MTRRLRDGAVGNRPLSHRLFKFLIRRTRVLGVGWGLAEIGSLMAGNRDTVETIRHADGFIRVDGFESDLAAGVDKLALG